MWLAVPRPAKYTGQPVKFLNLYKNSQTKFEQVTNIRLQFPQTKTDGASENELYCPQFTIFC